MYSLLLAVIYLAFISLGLPDSLLGSAWPIIHKEFTVPISYAGIVTMIIASGTIISSLMSARLTKKIGTGAVTAISVMMTAAALFGFSLSKSFFVVCLWAIPYGLGAGAVDAALNNYVALHYSSKHMSWLHCFWGVGASVSPYIMGFCLTKGWGWAAGYRYVGIIQIALTVILLASLPIWKRKQSDADAKAVNISIGRAVRIKGVKYMLAAFFAYCALETTAGLWASSYLVEHCGISPSVAANYASLFYLGITAGRFVNGFLAAKIKDKHLIRFGIVIIIAGIALLLIPLAGSLGVLAGLIVIGLGCAPIYPSIIHSTPYNFGESYSHAIIGVQMASAYLGSTLMPPLFGIVAQNINIGLYPAYLLVFAAVMLGMTEILNKLVQKNKASAI